MTATAHKLSFLLETYTRNQVQENPIYIYILHAYGQEMNSITSSLSKNGSKRIQVSNTRTHGTLSHKIITSRIVLGGVASQRARPHCPALKENDHYILFYIFHSFNYLGFVTTFHGIWPPHRHQFPLKWATLDSMVNGASRNKGEMLWELHIVIILVYIYRFWIIIVDGRKPPAPTSHPFLLEI